MTEDDYDDDSYVATRFAILEGSFSSNPLIEQLTHLLSVVLSNLERSFLTQGRDSESVRRNVEALEAVSETLKLMRYNIGNAPEGPDDAFREYAGFCRDVVLCLKGLALAEDARLAPFLLGPWVTALERYVPPE